MRRKRKTTKHKVYVDSTDAAYHIPDDFGGIRVFFSEESAKDNLLCFRECGITEITLDCSKPKVVVKEDLKLALENAVTGDQIAWRCIKEGPKNIWKEVRNMWWGISSFITSRCWRIYYKLRKIDV